MGLEQILAGHPNLWRGRSASAAAPRGVATGYPALDTRLCWGGWPPASLTEVLTERPEGALGLILPALSPLSQGPRWLLLVDPPLPPFAPALAARGLDLSRVVVVRTGGATAWAAEQGLRSRACSAVVIWGGETHWRGVTLRRLQLAAQRGDALALLFRGEAAACDPSPAALRLQVRQAAEGWEIRILKQRGAASAGAIRVPRLDAGLGSGPGFETARHV